MNNYMNMSGCPFICFWIRGDWDCLVAPVSKMETEGQNPVQRYDTVSVEIDSAMIESEIEDMLGSYIKGGQAQVFMGADPHEAQIYDGIIHNLSVEKEPSEIEHYMFGVSQHIFRGRRRTKYRIELKCPHGRSDLAWTIGRIITHAPKPHCALDALLRGNTYPKQLAIIGHHLRRTIARSVVHDAEDKMKDAAWMMQCYDNHNPDAYDNARDQYYVSASDYVVKDLELFFHGIKT